MIEKERKYIYNYITAHVSKGSKSYKLRRLSISEVNFLVEHFTSTFTSLIYSVIKFKGKCAYQSLQQNTISFRPNWYIYFSSRKLLPAGLEQVKENIII